MREMDKMSAKIEKSDRKAKCGGGGEIPKPPSKLGVGLGDHGGEI